MLRRVGLCAQPVAATALRTTLTACRLAADGAWSLLRGDNAPVAVAVLGEHLGGQRRRMQAPELFETVGTDVAELRNYGFQALRSRGGHGVIPLAARSMRE